jgi:hypothetical protein
MERRSSAAFAHGSGRTLMHAKHHCGVPSKIEACHDFKLRQLSSGTDLCVSWSVIGHIAATSTFQLPLLGPERIQLSLEFAATFFAGHFIRRFRFVFFHCRHTFKLLVQKTFAKSILLGWASNNRKWECFPHFDLPATCPGRREVVGEISTTITEKTACRINARFHKMKSGFLWLFVLDGDTNLLRLRSAGGHRRRVSC